MGSLDLSASFASAFFSSIAAWTFASAFALI
jgi:hypothetical protein